MKNHEGRDLCRLHWGVIQEALTPASERESPVVVQLSYPPFCKEEAAGSPCFRCERRCRRRAVRCYYCGCALCGDLCQQYHERRCKVEPDDSVPEEVLLEKPWSSAGDQDTSRRPPRRFPEEGSALALPRPQESKQRLGRLCACPRGCRNPVFGDFVACDYCLIEMEPQEE